MKNFVKIVSLLAGLACLAVVALLGVTFVEGDPDDMVATAWGIPVAVLGGVVLVLARAVDPDSPRRQRLAAAAVAIAGGMAAAFLLWFLWMVWVSFNAVFVRQ